MGIKQRRVDMYIIKNAFRCIGRSKGRNILIGIIALVIAVSACIGLSIRQATENAKESAKEEMSVTATISYDRQSMMGQIGGNKGEFDRDRFEDMMGNASALTLEEYKKYAEAKSVEDFYYTLSVSVNGDDALLPVSDDRENTNGFGGGRFPNMGGGMMGNRFTSGDFTIVGYSSDSAMTDFMSGNASVLEGGNIFEEGTTEYQCVVSEELALYNNLSVGDSIVIANPSLETETYTLTICGIYTSSQTNDFSMSMFGAGQDPANQIYMSAAALQLIVDASEKASEDALSGTISATYLFADTDSYYAFEEEVRTLGLDESYQVDSMDLMAFENSLRPLDTLSTAAGWFLLVILAIGAVILIVLNIFNVRERKYEVGVLTAMGMKKWKVATQFICEILIVTMLAVIIGAGIGAVSALPITNALLEGQVESQTSQQTQMENNFGRPGNFGGQTPPDMPSNIPGGMGDMFNNMVGQAADYITQVDSAMDLTVVVQMLGVGLLLTLVASAASVLFIMRYDPLKILANRD